MRLIPHHIKAKLWATRLRANTPQKSISGLFAASVCAVGIFVGCTFGIERIAHSQPLFGPSCPDAKTILEINDLLFATGFLCQPLDQAFHAAYDPWPSPTGPAPIRSEPAGVAATVKRLSHANAFDAAQIQLERLDDPALHQAAEAGVIQLKAGTVEALFLTDDLAGRAFRIGNGFDWEAAEALMNTLLPPPNSNPNSSPEPGENDKITDAKQAFTYIVLGSVLGAAEREAEPIQSVGWTRLPRWTNADNSNSDDDNSLRVQLALVERTAANWGSRAVLYLRLGARQLGLTTLNDDLFANYHRDTCRPVASWPTAAKQSLSRLLELDETCANVSNLALRNWDTAVADGMPTPAWNLE